MKHPERTATIFRHSFELAPLDGEGMRAMEEQPARHMKEAATEHAILILAWAREDSHADLSEHATTVTRNTSIQAMLTPISTEHQHRTWLTHQTQSHNITHPH